MPDFQPGDRVLVDFTDQPHGVCPCGCGRTGRYLGTVTDERCAPRYVRVLPDGHVHGRAFSEMRACVHPTESER